jgi:hypothetical protein
VNDMLEPVADGSVDIPTPEASARAHMAARLMNALVRLNQGFAALAPAAGGLRTEHFMDVFRQFAVHWDLGDLPPSGAQDPESTDAPAEWRAPCFPSTMKGRVATEEDRCDSEPVSSPRSYSASSWSRCAWWTSDSPRRRPAPGPRRRCFVRQVPDRRADPREVLARDQ